MTDSQQEQVLRVEGEVVADCAVAADYPGARISATERRGWLNGRSSSAPLTVIPVPGAVVTSAYTVMDPTAGRLFLNQTYADVQNFFGLAPVLDGSSFSYEQPTVYRPGRFVVVGGPIDYVWHHWLIQWSARLSVLNSLRPDLLQDQSVKFLVDIRASAPPFLDILYAYGISDDRIELVDHCQNHQLEEAYLVSFLDQNAYYPKVLDDHVRQIRQGLNVPSDVTGPPVRLFCSRQGYPHAKRRVDNFSEIEPLLLERGFSIVELGKLSAADQFSLFTRAEVVMGVHGADLAGILFCRPSAKLLLMENSRNLHSGLSRTYTTLADLRGMRHRTMLVDEVIDEGVDYTHFGEQHNRDYTINRQALLRTLAELKIR